MSNAHIHIQEHIGCAPPPSRQVIRAAEHTVEILNLKYKTPENSTRFLKDITPSNNIATQYTRHSYTNTSVSKNDLRCSESAVLDPFPGLLVLRSDRRENTG